jgi:hypothetical protein
VIDRTHGDDNAKARAIVDDAIAELLLLGATDRNQAAAMMATQAALRIDDNEVMKWVEGFVHNCIWDVDDTDQGAGA